MSSTSRFAVSLLAPWHFAPWCLASWHLAPPAKATLPRDEPIEPLLNRGLGAAQESAGLFANLPINRTIRHRQAKSVRTSGVLEPPWRLRDRPSPRSRILPAPLAACSPGANCLAKEASQPAAFGEECGCETVGSAIITGGAAGSLGAPEILSRDNRRVDVAP